MAERSGDWRGHAKANARSWSLVALGIGAIIGAGLFVRTAAAIAERAGPSVTLAFIVAGIGCAFAGLCYAEFASMIPIAGSAYTYSYATMGELVAWIIGWDLVLEYAVGAATVAIAWSEYFNKVLEFFGLRDPVSMVPLAVRDIARRRARHHEHSGGRSSCAVLSALLIRGTQESACVNNLIVITKVSIVLMVIVIGWGFINPANHTPFIPEATTYTDARGRDAQLRRHHGDPRRRRRRVLRLHRLRRGVDGRAGSEESRSATCRSASSARWSSARSSTCCSRTC